MIDLMIIYDMGCLRYDLFSNFFDKVRYYFLDNSSNLYFISENKEMLKDLLRKNITRNKL